MRTCKRTLKRKLIRNPGITSKTGVFPWYYCASNSVIIALFEGVQNTSINKN